MTTRWTTERERWRDANLREAIASQENDARMRNTTWVDARGIRETSEATMIAAHKAGIAYWRRNRPVGANAEALSLARSCGWHGADETAWLAGFYGAKLRHEQQEMENAAEQHHSDFHVD